MLFALASLLLAVPQNPFAGAEPDGNKLVKVELVSERAKLHPGERFTLAARLSVSRGWHIYWGENPGDTGVPTRLELEGPKEFTLGPARFPVPERHTEPGDLVAFVHEGQVLVLFDAVAPAKLAPGEKVRFELSASWLVCTTRCFAGEGEASLELECAAAGAELPANEALFKDARAKLPRPLSELKGLRSSLQPVAGKADECRVVVAVADALELGFLPAEQKNPAFVSSTTAPDGGLELLYRWRELPQGKAQVGCPGILSLKTKDGPAHYWLDLKYDVGS